MLSASKRVANAALLLILFGLLANPAYSRVTYFHTNHLGSPVAATDSAGEILWRARYRPYGDRDSLPALVNNRRWLAAHTHDDDVGLTYMKSRYYDPVIGRFMSTDSLAFNETKPGSFGRYTYANNNPYLYVDPDGRDSIVFSAQVGGAAGAGAGSAQGFYVTFPDGDTDAPFDFGTFASVSALLGVDGTASLNAGLLAGGRENIEGSSVTTSFGATLMGVGGEVQSIVNPDTQKFAGATVGFSTGLPVTASAAFSKTIITFSARDFFWNEEPAATTMDVYRNEDYIIGQFYHFAQ